MLSDQPFFLPDASGWLTVPAGAVSAAFSLPTTLVPEQIVAHISASCYRATATVTAPLTINLTNRGRRWDLNNVVFKDGGRATGYFVYDSETGQYLAVNIQVTQATPTRSGQSAGPGSTEPLLLPLAERVHADVRKQSEHGLSNGTAKPGDFRPEHSGVVDAAAIQFRTAAYERGRDDSSGRSIQTGLYSLLHT